MKLETQLDSVVFQLTPTRTRYDLVINAKGKSEKISSGLVNPFLTHLKTAHDQIAEGGYTIRLKPEPGANPVWFTKGTVERFVRYVSSPEILERVNSLELEILQIKKAIDIQGNDNLGFSTVEHHQSRWKKCKEGSNSSYGGEMEKAMVLYKHELYSNSSNGANTKEDNSRVQLLRVLETRKNVLRKEQGMAFACAVAAGFDMDHVKHLISFAESFGAFRLLEACLCFMKLWQAKHRAGQWTETADAKGKSCQSEFSSLKASDATLSGDKRKQEETKEGWPVSIGDVGTGSSGKVSNKTIADLSSQHQNTGHLSDKMPSSDLQASLGSQYNHGQIQNHVFPQWPSHFPSGPQTSQSYPVQDMVCYHNVPGIGSFVTPQYPQMQEPWTRTIIERNAMDSKASNIWPQERESDTVANININYTSKGYDISAREPQSDCDAETEEQIQDVPSGAPERWHKMHSRSLKKNGNLKKSINTSNTNDEEKLVCGQEQDAGKWQAFQNLLLRAQKVTHKSSSDPIVENECGNASNLNKSSVYNASDESFVVPLRSGLHDGLVKDKKTIIDGSSEMSSYLQKNEKTKNQHVYEPNDLSLMPKRGLEKGSVGYDLAKDFEMQTSLRNDGRKSVRSKDDVSKGIKRPEKVDKERKSSGAQDALQRKKMDAMMRTGKSSKLNTLAEAQARAAKLRAFKTELQKVKKEKEEEEIKRLEALKRERQKRIAARSSSNVAKSPLNLQQIGSRKPASSSSPLNLQQIGSRKPANSSQSSYKSSKFSDTAPANSSPLQKLPRSNTIKAPSSLNPQMSRAQMTTRFSPTPSRSTKFTDTASASSSPLQKLPRSSANVTQSTLNPLCIVARRATRPSPSSCIGSKFSDTVPTSSSPIQKLPIRITSVGSNNSETTTKINRLNGDVHLFRNGLRLPITSVHEQKKESNSITPEAKVTSVQAKRVSDPKVSDMHCATPVRLESSKQVPKKTVPVERQSKKATTYLHVNKTKSGPLPENKIRISREPSDKIQKNAAMKDTENTNGIRTLLTSEVMPVKRTNVVASMLGVSGDEPIIDKAVVMLGKQRNHPSAVQASEESINTYGDCRREKIELVPEFADIHGPPSPPNRVEIKTSSKCNKQPSYCEVVKNPKDGFQKFSISIADVKAYQTPFARSTSSDDPTTSIVEPLREPVVLKASVVLCESAKACASNSANSRSVKHIHEIHEKPHSKEPSKQFRGVIKFLRKGQCSASSEGCTKGLDVNHCTVAVASNKVPTLKDLLSQDSQHIKGNPPKGSHPFSFLSPFQIRSTKKKPA